MPLDFGALSALSGGFTDWNAVRSMKERALQFREQQNNIEQQNLRNNQLASAKIQEYEDTIHKAGLLEPDKKRVQAKERELHERIKDGVMKFGGDADAYINGGGLTELHDYQQDLINSDEMATGLSNFYNKNKIDADAAAGLILRNNADGRDVHEGLKDYYAGKTKNIEYNGAFERPEGDPRKYFGENYGNYGKTPQAATPQDVFDYWFQSAKGKGRNIADAKQFAASQTKGYMAGLATGEAPYQYKSEDALKQELMRSQIYKNYKKGAGEGEHTHMDWLYDVNEGYAKPDAVPTDENKKPIINPDGTTSYKYRIPASLAGHIAETVGVQYDHKGNVANKSALIGRNDIYLENGQKLSIGNLSPDDIKGLELGNEYVTHYNPKTDRIEKQGIKAKLHLGNNGLERSATVKDGKIVPLSTAWGDNNVPGVSTSSSWNPWSKIFDTDASESGTVDVILPLNYKNLAERYNLDKKTPLISKNDRGVYAGMEQENEDE